MDMVEAQPVSQPKQVKYTEVLKWLRKGKIFSISVADDGRVLMSAWDSEKKVNIPFQLSRAELAELSIVAGELARK